MTSRAANLTETAYNDGARVGRKGLGVKANRTYDYQAMDRMAQGSFWWSRLHGREKVSDLGEECLDAFRAGVIDGLYERKAWAVESGHAEAAE